MLKIVQDDFYYKNGGKIITYKVTGPKAEVDEYVAIESSRRNVVPEQVPKATDGSPIFWLSERNEFNNGRVPQKSYTLRKNHDGTRFNLDTSAVDNTNAARLNDLVLGEQAKILAQRRMGIGTERPATAPTRTPAPATKGADIADDIIDNVGEQEEEHAPAGAGGETIGD